MVNTQVDNLSGFGNTFAEHDIKLSNTEWRSNLVFNNFNFYAVTRYFVGILNLRYTAYVQTNRSIKLKRVTSGGSFRVTGRGAGGGARRGGGGAAAAGGAGGPGK